MNVPHTPPEKMKVKVLRVRVTEDEHKICVEKAKLRGFDTYSDYIRALIEQDCTENKNEPPFNCIGEEII